MEHNMNNNESKSCGSGKCGGMGGCCMGSFWTSKTFIFVVGLVLGMIILSICHHSMMKGDRVMWKMDNKMMKGENMKGDDMAGDDKMMGDMKMPKEMTQ